MNIFNSVYWDVDICFGAKFGRGIVERVEIDFGAEFGSGDGEGV